MKYFANSEESSDSDRSPGLDLLPVSGTEAEGDHVFLAESRVFPYFSNSTAQPREEFSLIHHLWVCKVPRAETPRAD